MIRPLVISILALSALAVAGCGSDSSSSAEPLPKWEFIAKADLICAGAKDELDALMDEVRIMVESGDSAPEKLASLHREAGDVTESEIESLRELDPPPADQELVNSMLATMDTEVSQIEESADAMDNGDLAELETLAAKTEATAAKAKGIAQGYGFKVCGSDD